MITILESTEYPIAQMGKMAGICWGADISTHTVNFTRGKECIESGHGRVTEYSDIIIEISEYSARMIRELYTHTGRSSSQGSLMLYNIGSLNLVKKLLKLPRKKKKRLGTKKARKKVLNKVKRNLPVSVKQLKRAGLTLTFPTMIKL